MSMRASVSLGADLGLAGPVQVRDLWQRRDLGVTENSSFSPPAAVPPRDSAFFLLTLSK